MITSTSNAQIKAVVQLMKKAKARRERGLFVVEGIKMFKEAPKECLEKVYVSSALWEKGIEIEEDIQVEVVEEKVFCAISDTVTPQGILCLVRRNEYRLEDMISEKGGKKPLLMILEDLQDPGNLGTILRTAEGAGVTGIIMSKNTVDVYNPKVIRSTMGSVYRMPLLYADRIQDILPKLNEAGIRTYAAHLKGENNYEEENYRGGTAFFIGNEGNGLSDELSEKADCLIKIPMEGKVESLNAAMAAGILMYESARQRRSDF